MATATNIPAFWENPQKPTEQPWADKPIRTRVLITATDLRVGDGIPGFGLVVQAINSKTFTFVATSAEVDLLLPLDHKMTVWRTAA